MAYGTRRFNAVFTRALIINITINIITIIITIVIIKRYDVLGEHRDVQNCGKIIGNNTKK